MVERNAEMSPHATPGFVPAAATSLANGEERTIVPSTKRGREIAPALENKDSKREVVETIVFVVVLVLLLKSFVAEAFVIPTGSMATTLYGYNKKCKCPRCGTVQPINCSDE